MPRSNKPNTPKDHFISPAAHYLEEAIGYLYAIEMEDDTLPDKELVRIKIIRDHLSRAYAREAKRRGHEDVGREVLRSLRR